MTEPLRVFVNGTGVSVPAGSTVIDAVAAADSAAAAEVRGGTRVVADSRGIPVAADTPLSGGYVMRLVSARQRTGTDGTADAHDAE
ncbi:MAG: (2Fe-2S)-binding protein [Gemmatimonadetes bacterium]|nr:(2Fe-2S)-binding protein [Gemmatimonadota bacterium]